jgi:hypothetical protein
MGIPFITDLSPQDGDVIVVFGAQEKADTLYYIQQMKKIHFILIQTEQFHSKVFDNKYYIDLVQHHSVIDFGRLNVEQLKSKIQLKVFSFYFFDFMALETSAWEDRPIDFFFCGAASEERKKMLAEFQLEHPTAKFEIDLSYSYVNPNMMMEKLKQVKYVINIPFYPNNSLETHRINRALSAGCEVISLYSKDKHANKMYDPYVHFVKDLSEFTCLIEHERKGNYAALMEDFGTKMIESNIRGIRHAEMEWKKKHFPEVETILV